MTKASDTIAADRTLTTTRVFDAPRALVFKAWTDPKQFARWFPPDGFTVSAFPIRIVGENGAPVRVVAELSG